MVSLDEIKERFRNFLNKVSKKKGKRLDKEGLLNFSIQAQILMRLIEGKGFVSEVKALDKIRKKVVSSGIIEEEDVRELNGILNII